MRAHVTAPFHFREGTRLEIYIMRILPCPPSCHDNKAFPFVEDVLGRVLFVIWIEAVGEYINKIPGGMEIELSFCKMISLIMESVVSGKLKRCQFFSSFH